MLYNYTRIRQDQAGNPKTGKNGAAFQPKREIGWSGTRTVNEPNGWNGAAAARTGYCADPPAPGFLLSFSKTPRLHELLNMPVPLSTILMISPLHRLEPKTFKSMRDEFDPAPSHVPRARLT